MIPDSIARQFPEAVRYYELLEKETRYDSLSTRHARAIEALMSAPDCGDNSCHFAMHKGGMRTNGGCRCTLQQAREWASRARSVIAEEEKV